MENIHEDSTYDNTGICSPDDFGVNIVDNDLYSDYSEQDPQGIPTESDDPLYAQVSQKSNQQYEGVLYDQSPTVDYIELPYGGTQSETTVEFNNVVNEKRLAKKMQEEDSNCTGKLKLILLGVAIGLIIVFAVVACTIILTQSKDSEEAGLRVTASGSTDTEADGMTASTTPRMSSRLTRPAKSVLPFRPQTSGFAHSITTINRRGTTRPIITTTRYTTRPPRAIFT